MLGSSAPYTDARATWRGEESPRPPPGQEDGHLPHPVPREAAGTRDRKDEEEDRCRVHRG